MILESTRRAFGSYWDTRVLDRTFAALNSTDSDVIVLPRRLDLDVSHMVDVAPLTDHRVMVPANRSMSLIRDSLRRIEMESDRLVEDVDALVQLFAQLFDQNRIELRMEITDRQSCPKFHCDNVYVRLLTTYYGPTTEYIDVNEPEAIQRVPLNACVFLKGHKNPTYRDRMLHRSPPVDSGTKRFCVILNFDDWIQRH